MAVRVRPLSEREQSGNEGECIAILEDERQIVLGNEHTFSFDQVYTPAATQRTVFDVSVAPLLQRFLEGYSIGPLSVHYLQGNCDIYY